jgi:hypothetical protein
MDDQNPQLPESDNFTADEVTQSRQRARINGLIVAAVLLLGVVAPPPWNLYAPVLFLIPIILGLLDRLRRITVQNNSVHSDSVQSDSVQRNAVPGAGPIPEPYSYTPRDPGDPRRYKPIG